MMLLWLACATPPPPEPVRFVRGALIFENGRVEDRAWTPGEVIRDQVAPMTPECVPLRTEVLEDRRAEAEMGMGGAGAALAFSPDSRRLAIGSVGGELRVVPVGREGNAMSLNLAEGAVKALAWSEDGATLYVGEQSPDAFIYALDPQTLETRWRLRLADRVESSVLPPDDTIYGRFSLPGAYAIRVLPGGDVIVAGAHGWVVDGVRKNRSQVLRLGPDGAVKAAFPEDGAADAVFLFPSVVGERVLLGISRSADGPAPDLPVGGLVALNPDFSVAWTRQFAPLEPYFTSVFFWEAVVLGQSFSFAGLGDGRAFLLDEAGTVTTELSPGAPMVTGGVPIATGVGYATVIGDVAYYLTTQTNIPWGSADPATRPPAAHPAENTVHALARDGSARWSKPLRHAVAGVAASPDGQSLLIGGGPRESDTRTDLFGAVVLDVTSGAVVTTCSTAAPVDFRPVWSPDGAWIAVAEAPFKDSEGRVLGSYQVTLFR